MKSKFMSVLLILSIVFASFPKVSAMEITSNLSDENITIEVSEGSKAQKEFFENPSDVINGNLYSTSKPTKFWNLSSNDYNGNLVEVRSSWLYTNYYFFPNSSGALNLDYWIEPVNAAGTKMTIKVYDVTAGKFVSTYTTAGAPTGACITFRGLNTTHHYAIAFQAVRDPLAYNAVEGTFVVYH